MRLVALDQHRLLWASIIFSGQPGFNGQRPPSTYRLDSCPDDIPIAPGIFSVVGARRTQRLGLTFSGFPGARRDAQKRDSLVN